VSREYALQSHPVWAEIAPEIVATEFHSPWSMDANTLRRLSRVRRASGVIFRFISDARVPDSGVGVSDSAHNERPCTAVDLRVLNGRERYLILMAALKEGYERIGVYPPNADQIRMYGKSSGSIHLDDSDLLPRQVCWTGY